MDLEIHNRPSSLGDETKRVSFPDDDEVFQLDGVSLRIGALTKIEVGDLDLEGQHKSREFVLLTFFNDSLRFSVEIPVELAGEIADRIKQYEET